MLHSDTTSAAGYLPRSQPVEFYRALQYPFQGQGWFSRILILALVQLLPLIGQLLLLGYGVQVVRAVYAGQSDLPRMEWRRALGDGLRMAVTGLLYMMPILLTGILFLLNSGGGAGMTLPVVIVLSIIVAPLASRLQKRSNRVVKLLGKLLALVPLIAVAVSVVSGVASFVNARNNASAAIQSANPIGWPLLFGLPLLVFIILTGTLVGGVRFAIERKGLFDAPGNVKLLLAHRKATASMMLNLLALLMITVLATGLGFVLFIVPGLFVFAACSITIWYLLACFGKQVGIHPGA